MRKQSPRLNPKWVKEARDYFIKFLKTTKFPEIHRNGTRGTPFNYPEWLVMFIAVLSVKSKVTSYVGMHKLASQYWDTIVEGMQLDRPPISERQLRDRLKKICHSPRKPAAFIFQVFPQEVFSLQGKCG